MADNMISPANRAAPAGFEPATAQLPRTSLVDKAPAERLQPKAEAKIERAVNQPRPMPAGARDVRLRFEIDPKTNEVTVLLIDVASRRVVRTIPPDELRNMAEKELVDLFA